MTRILLGKHQNSLGNPPCQEASPVLSHNNPNPFGQVRQKGYTILFGCFFSLQKTDFAQMIYNPQLHCFGTNDCSTKTSLFHLQCPRVLFLGFLCLFILCGSVLLCVAVPGGQSRAFGAAASSISGPISATQPPVLPAVNPHRQLAPTLLL